MGAVEVFLLAVACVLLVGAAGELLFPRTRIPDPLWLIAGGIGLRLSGVVDDAMLRAITPFFAALALIIVLFEGGSRLVLSELRGAAGRGGVLALATFGATTLLVALFSLGLAALGVLEAWTFTHGVMLGAIVGGPSALLVAPSLRLVGAGERLGALLRAEASLTDALAAAVTVACIDIIVAGSLSAGAALLALGRSFGVAALLGGLVGWAWIPAMRALRGDAASYPLILAGLMLLYVLVDAMGGSPAMGVLAFAIVVGNARHFTRWLHEGDRGEGISLGRDVRAVHAQLSFIIKSLFFAFVGLLLAPPWSLLVMGALMGLALFFARLPGVYFTLRGAGLEDRELATAFVCLPRGLAAGALATLPMMAGVPGAERLPPLVFSAITATIVIFTVGFARAQRGRWDPRLAATARREEGAEEQFAARTAIVAGDDAAAGSSDRSARV
ncbi:MAG: cation:proton antiporter [Nannocystis sp.]|nr:cation:proton antiporter [Nannocystis sp.]